MAAARPLAGLRVLLIVDTASLRMVYRSVLIHAGAEVRMAATAADGLAQFRAWPVPVVLLDLALPDGDGLVLMRELRALRSDLRVVVITAHGGVGRAVQAMRAGAHDFLVKPFDGDRLVAATRGAVQSLQAPGRRPRAIAEGLGAMVGASRAMAAVALSIAAAAPAMAPVLISGEAGTGKELCARMLHALSGRASGPFLAIHCRNRSEVEAEQALFSDRGALYAPQEATLYLAELPDLPLPLQRRLVQLVQRNPSGDGADRGPGPVRLVAGMTGPPEAAQAAGRLDPALFRLLDTVRIDLPPLRARGRDVVEIARAALAHFGAETDKRFDGLSAPVEELFCHLPWPGNVGELLSLIRQIVLVQPGGIVTLDMLPDRVVPALIRSATASGGGQMTALASPDPQPKAITRTEAIQALAGMTLIEVERAVIEAAIAAAEGSLPRAAKALGLAPSTLYRKRQAWIDGTD